MILTSLFLSIIYKQSPHAYLEKYCMSPVSILLAHSQKALKQDSNQQVAWLACFHTTVLTNNKFKNQHLSLSYTKLRIINTAFIFSSN